MKKNIAYFAGSLFIASPVIVAFFLAQHFVNKIDETPWCNWPVTHEVPPCLPDVMDEESIESMIESESGLYMACERHQHGDDEPARPTARKYVIAALEMQP